MRNSIQVMKEPQKGPSFASLKDGQMFRCENPCHTGNVYMKISQNSYGSNAILLTTGAVYDFKGDKPIWPVALDEVVAIRPAQ